MKNLKSIDLHIDEQICLFEKENMIYFDEIIKIEELKNFCKQNKIKAIGLSDTNNLCGALEFAEKIKSTYL